MHDDTQSDRKLRKPYAVHWIEAGQSRSLVFSTAEARDAYARLLDEDSGVSHIECLNYTTEKGWQS